MQQRKFYNLDGLRFFAALFVVIDHTESIKAQFHLHSFSDVGFFTQTGALAVKFFFVLSGFLITFFLLIEQQKKGTVTRKINLGAFYKNRVLRIWPLYYALIICTFFIFPHFVLLQYPGYNIGFIYAHFNSFLLYLFFLPNLSLFLHGNILYLGQLWSLSVEEFFYLYFPLLIYFSRPRTVFKTILMATGAYALVIQLYYQWKSFHAVEGSLVQYFFVNYQLFIFLFGALAALIYVRLKDKIWIIKYKAQLKIIAYILFLLTVLLIIYCFKFPDGKIVLAAYPFLFALLILLLCISQVNIWLLNRRFIVYFGKISYGIYMLHPIVIVVCAKLFTVYTGNTITDTILFDAAVAAGTILLASGVYRLLEKPFLKLKQR